MKYSLEFAEKVLKAMKRPDNKLAGICDVMSDCKDPVTTNLIWDTYMYIKERFPEEQYDLIYDEGAKPIKFVKDDAGCYCFGSQRERIEFLESIVKELRQIEVLNKPTVSELAQEEAKTENSVEVKVELTFFQKVKQFLNKLIKWQ